jgi:hypothetical protein
MVAMNPEDHPHLHRLNLIREGLNGVYIFSHIEKECQFLGIFAR